MTAAEAETAFKAIRGPISWAAKVRLLRWTAAAEYFSA